jgi:hypothetical protein
MGQMSVLRICRQFHFERANVVAELFGVPTGLLDRLALVNIAPAFMHVHRMGVMNASGCWIVQGHDPGGDDPGRFSGVQKQRMFHDTVSYVTESQKKALNSPMELTL